MANLDTVTIARRSIQGTVALTSRYLLINAVGFIVQLIILPLYISPSALGVFAVVSAAIGFLVYFSDIGLAAALIQKKEEITKDDLRTTFTIQQILVVIIVMLGFLLSGFVSTLYDLDKPGTMLYYAFLASFFLASLKTVPSVMLERRLEFNKLIIPQIAETLVYYGITAILVIKGFGITSFAYAVLARGVVGLVAIYIIAPWKPTFGIVMESAKKLLSFGFPFQANSILALVKDNLLLLVLGKVLTQGEVGYLYGFARKWATVPLQFGMESIIKVTFPVFSRLQNDEKGLKRAIEKSLFMTVTIVGPLLVGVAILMPYFLRIFPQYSRWEPAIFSLSFFAAEAFLSSISTPLTNVLNAIGKIRVTLRLMQFWIVATWAATFIGIQLFGFNGVSIAAFFVSLSVVLVIIIVKRYVQFNITKAILPPVVASFVMGIFLFYASPFIITNLVGFILAIGLSAIMYLGLVFLIAGKELRSDIRLVRQLLKREDTPSI